MGARTRPDYTGRHIADSTPRLSKSLRRERTHDEAGRLLTLLYPARWRTGFYYNADGAGRVLAACCALPDGARRRRQFDARGRQTAVMRASSAAAVGVRYGWGGWSRLRAADHGDGQAVKFARDARGRVVQRSLEIGFSVRFACDFLGRLESIETPTGSIAYEYQAGANRAVRRLPDGVWSAWDFLPDGRLQSIAHADAVNRIFLKLDYAYRPDGLIREVRE